MLLLQSYNVIGQNDLQRITNEMLREVQHMNNHIMYLEESLDSCSTRLDKAKAAIAMKQFEIDNLEFIDDQNIMIVNEQQGQIQNLEMTINNLKRKDNLKTRLLICTPFIAFLLGTLTNNISLQL